MRTAGERTDRPIAGRSSEPAGFPDETPAAQLEGEPRLQFNGPSAQRALRLAKGGAVNDAWIRCAWAISRTLRQRSEVQLVEDVVQVGAELEPGALTKHWQSRQPERLGKGHVHVKVARPPE
jgi:hypothetical protein